MHVILLNSKICYNLIKSANCVSLKKIINNVYITRTHGLINASFWIRAFFVARSSFETARGFFFCKRWKSNANHWMIREALTRKFVMFICLYNYSVICSFWHLVIGEVAAKCRLYFTKSDLSHPKLSFRRHLAGFVNTFSNIVEGMASYRTT